MDLSGLPTYHACILQARAYRTLRLFMIHQLKKYDLTMMEWVLLGLVANSQKSEYSMSDLADILDVGLPLVTNMVDRVASFGYIDRKVSSGDKRLKYIIITKKGLKLAKKIEQELRQNMKLWLSDINRQELEGYVKTMTMLSQKNPQL